MAHVPGEKVAASAAKMAEEAVCPMMMESAMGEMMGSGMGGMMGSGMGGMMGSGMGGMMMGPGMGPATMPRMMTGVATGAAMSASSAKGRSLLVKMVTHPLVLFSAGLALGFLIHKYREEIIQKASRAVESGQDIAS